MLSPPCAPSLHNASGPNQARGSASQQRRSGPAKMRRSDEPPQGPAGVVVDIGDETQFPARLNHPGERLDHGVGNDPTLVVSPFRPRVGIMDEDAGKEGVRRGLDDRLGVAAPQPDVDKILALDPRQGGDNAIEERLAADQADLRTGSGAFDQMLARTKADLEPDLARVEGKERRGRERLRRKFDLRQDFREQALLSRPQGLAAAAPV